MDKKIDRKCYAYWLCSLPGIGNQTVWKLLDRYHMPQRIFEAPEKELEQILTQKQMESMCLSRSEWKMGEAYDKLKSQRIRFLTWEEEGYPQRLKTIPDAPYGLFFKGTLPREEQLSVAIIGARDCSEYGRYVAEGLGRYLGEHGVQVISGMARGIDGISQGAALDAGGLSFGVLGCGVDICYPRQNQRLYDRLLEKGGILSAYPPGSPPRPQNFPPRNRIVSGLADAVIVIEARYKSGTLITVDMALEQGRDVYVVPGRVTDRLSDGCNSLLKQGAEVFLSPEAFLQELQEGQSRRLPKRRAGSLKQEKESWVDEEAESIKPKDDFEVNDMQIDNGKECGSVYRTEKRQQIVKERGNSGAERDVWLNQQARDKEEQVRRVLDFYPQSIEEIRSRLPEGCDVQALSGILMKLCLEDIAVQVSSGHFCLKA